MHTLDALSAIRSLDALPVPRRRHLAALALDAPTDPDRARIVRHAREEERRVRENLEADLKADHAARAAWTQRTAERPSEAPQRSSQRVDRTESTTPAHRPVTVTWGEPTRTATAQQVRERRPLNGPVRHHGSESSTPAKPKPEPKPRALPDHGTLGRYQNPHACRCSLCRAAKSAANRREREKRAAKRANAQSTY